MDSSWTETCEWLLDVRDRVPEDVQQRTRLLVLDTLACAVAGLRFAEVEALAANATAVSAGSAGFPGLARGLTPGAAAAVFTSAAVFDEFCEGSDAARGRAGLHSVGLPLMLAESQELTVGEVLFAVLAGYEVGARFGAALFTLEGLHVDGSWGTAAAAAAAAVSLRLDEQWFAEAVGIATATPLATLYLSVPRGATARNIYAARGVAGGLECAVAAASGLTAPDGALGAIVGLLGRPGSGQFPAPGDFLLPEGYLKPWPGVRHAHYAIAAATRQRQHDPAGAELDDGAPITLTMHPAALEYAGVRAPATRLQAQFSCTYAAARILATGGFDLSAYTEEALADPVVQELERRIVLVAGQADGRYAEIAVGDHHHRADVAPGVGLPVSQVRAKALSLMTPSLGEERAVAVADWILGAEADELWRLPG